MISALEQKFKQYVPLAAWLMAIVTLGFAGGRVVAYGYLPADDALRHAAKAVSGKPWSEIMLMRGGFEMDPYPGWHTILGGIHHLAGGDTERLVVITVVGLMLLYNLATLAWFRRPEAWLAALLGVAIFAPNFIILIFQGRPFVLTMTVYTALLLMWSNPGDQTPRLRELLATILSIGAIAWIHGSFYQLILPALGLLAAARWRQAIWFGACWAAGSFLGASLTGHPWQFLEQCLRFLSGALGDYTVSRQLVTEFMPSDGDPAVVLAVVAMILWRARSPDWRPRDLLQPVFMMGVVGWLLGLKVGRFWYDWGLPAIVLWLALEFQRQFETQIASNSGKRLVLTLGICLGVFLSVAADRNGRWTANLNKQYLTPDKPELAGWLPGDRGIIYSADMTVFYDTFFRNPTAPWRYALGYEPALMPADDLAVLRKVQWNYGDVLAYEPWVKKMRPEDRLIISTAWLTTPGPPNIPELQWNFVLNSLWIGRTPQKPAAAGSAR